MSYWQIEERAKNIGTESEPNYVTVWYGVDEEGNEHYMVNSKPDSTTESGPIFGVQGGPDSMMERIETVEEAIEKYKEDAEFLGC